MTGPSEFSVPVTVQLPRAMYGRLRAVSRRHGVSVGVLLVEAARRGLVVAGEGKPSKVRKRKVSAEPRRMWSAADDAEVRRMHAERMSDTAIAEVLGWSQGAVGRHREALGLPALYPGRPKKVRG